MWNEIFSKFHLACNFWHCRLCRLWPRSRYPKHSFPSHYFHFFFHKNKIEIVILHVDAAEKEVENVVPHAALLARFEVMFACHKRLWQELLLALSAQHLLQV